MNSHAKTVIDFLESLRQTTKSISESRANKISSESLEDTFQQVLSDGGFVDLNLNNARTVNLVRFLKPPLKEVVRKTIRRLKNIFKTLCLNHVRYDKTLITYFQKIAF